MRGHIPSYKLISPAGLPDALSVLAGEPGVWQPFAGGTDLMVLLESGKLPHKNYLNIWNLAELRGIEATDNHITLGALTTYTEIQSDPILRAEFPMLCQRRVKGRTRHSKSRHARWQHCQRLPRRLTRPRRSLPTS